MCQGSVEPRQFLREPQAVCRGHLKPRSVAGRVHNGMTYADFVLVNNASTAKIVRMPSDEQQCSRGVHAQTVVEWQSQIPSLGSLPPLRRQAWSSSVASDKSAQTGTVNDSNEVVVDLVPGH